MGRYLLLALLGVSLAVHASGPGGSSNAVHNGAAATASDGGPANAPPLRPYPRRLPLRLSAPSMAQAGKPLVGVHVTLRNPGKPAPASRLRLIIHYSDTRHTEGRPALGPDNIQLEVFQRGAWIPVRLGMVEGGVMGAIGPEGVGVHRERHKRGGFSIPAGFAKTWKLRLTFRLPGKYALVAAVSPDNGSRHLSQPAHSTIEVQ